jgi:hypothetical protein
MFSTVVARARDFWDRISPRERRLVVIAAVAVPLTLALWLGFAISDGLSAMEARNDKMRRALRIVSDLRARGKVPTDGDDVLKKMGTEQIALDVYLTNAAKKAKFELKSTITPRPAQTKNGFVTTISSLTLDKLTIEQLKDFLTEIESGSKQVMVTHLELRRDFRDKDKLTLNVDVSAFSREPKEKTDGSGAATASESSGGG